MVLSALDDSFREDEGGQRSVSTVKKVQYLSIEDYLAGELKSEVRHEYIDGQIFAMVGASKRHNLIACCLLARIREHLKPPCHVYFADVKVQVGSIFYYPDLVVSCAAESESPYYEKEPSLIVEVLSPSTESKDRFEKRLVFQRLDSLQEYMLVSQDKEQIEIYRREQDGWVIASYQQGDTVSLDSIGLKLPIQDIYADVINLL